MAAFVTVVKLPPALTSSSPTPALLSIAETAGSEQFDEMSLDFAAVLKIWETRRKVCVCLQSKREASHGEKKRDQAWELFEA